MKAAFLTGARELGTREVADPIAPDDGLVLSVKACGVCGSDLRRWKEGPPDDLDSIVPGHEVSGVVEVVGKDMTRYAPGDHLAVAPDIHCGTCYYCDRGMYNLCNDLRLVGITPGYPGGFAEKMVLTSEILSHGIVHRVPDGVSFLEGALAEPISSVLAAHEKARTCLDDTVVILGAGPIGCLHTAVCKARGARVIISEPSQERREMAQRFDPEAIVDPFDEDLTARVRELTHGLGADIAVCANPVAATQTQAVEIVRKAGRVILFGGLPKTNPMTTLDGNRIHYGEISVVGAFSYHPTFHELALELLERKLIPSDLLITHTFDLEHIDQAFMTAAGGAGLKVIVTS
ncbi:MAG: alcohol dehydrogenase catalytic domain-containing protein [Anaerolineae bacterium]|jgi:L-iditol 2-dehydrogenase